LTEIIAPDIDLDEANYAHCQVVEILPIKAEDFFKWYMIEPPENFMRGTLVVSPVTGTGPLPGPDYGVEGSARTFSFKDGTVASERILSTNLPHEYFYQPYAYNNPMCMLADYAKSTMRSIPEGDNARIVWDYAFHARNKLALPFVKMFVSLDWKRNMANGLKIIKAHLAEHGTTKSIHEVENLNKAA